MIDVPFKGKLNARSIAAACLLIACVCTSAYARTTATSWHQIADKRTRADRTSATTSKNLLKVSVEHLFGISKTELVLDKGVWPPDLQIEFRRFKAVEGFVIRTPSKTFKGSIAFSTKGPAIDLGEGFTAKKKQNRIYIYAPRRFVEKNDKTIKLEWVDFYRN